MTFSIEMQETLIGGGELLPDTKTGWGWIGRPDFRPDDIRPDDAIRHTSVVSSSLDGLSGIFGVNYPLPFN